MTVYTLRWFSNSKMTVFVEEEDGIIIDSSPITRKFIGQPLDNLKRWMKKQSGFKEEIMK